MSSTNSLRTTQAVVLRVVTLGSASGRYGGPFDTARRQVELMKKRGYDATILAGHLKNDGPDFPDVETYPVRRWLPVDGFVGLASAAVVRAIWREVRRADIVHISMSRELVPVIATLAAIVTRTPLVLQPHGMLTARTSRLHRAVDPVVRLLLRKAAMIIALTDVEAAAIQVWSRRDLAIEVIGNPSPTICRRRRASAETPVALFAARLHPRKRVHDFIAAARLASQHGDNVHYVVAGPDQGDLNAVLNAAKALKNFSYMGPLSQAQLDLSLAECAVFVLPSRDEPWGNVLVSAIKAGIPVVVTESAALAPEIRSAGLGHVVNDEDPRAIRRAVLDATTCETENTGQGQALGRFDNERIGDALQAVYNKVMRRESLHVSRSWGSESLGNS